jgi:hypothetical protein
MGLVGVGIATLTANFLYCLLSLIIVLPNLNLYFPKITILKMLISFIPTAGILYLFKAFGASISGVVQMIVLLIAFYGIYYACGKTFIKNS